MAGSEAQRPAAPAAGEAEIALILALGRALHAYGAPAPRLEGTLSLLAGRFGLAGQFFATPTAIFAAFGPVGHQSTSLMRVQPGGVDLGMRVAIEELVREVLDGRIGAREAQTRLDALLAAPRGLSPVATVLCFGLSSACAARFFGGGVAELLLALALGSTTGLLSLAAARSEGMQRVFEPLAAFVVSALAVLAAHWAGPLSIYTATVSGLIVLLPGLSLTSAMSELAARHLASGTARLMGSAMTFLSLGFGVALGWQIGEWLPPRVGAAAQAALPSWTLLPALLGAPIGFGLLLRARTRDLLWIVAVSIAGFAGARLGAEWFGHGIGVALGAFVVGTASNALGRVLGRPSAVTVVPGILMLVPGAIGFQSLSSLISRDVLSGVEAGFSMALVGISLVAGLLLANVVLPPRRHEREVT